MTNVNTFGNSPLCEKQGKTVYNTSKWWNPFPDPVFAGAAPSFLF